MSKTLRSWRQSVRYRATIRSLKALSQQELSALWLRPSDIDEVAKQAAGF
jgi:uncharacterized protein YjiS (DUF1127 family)